MNLASMKVSDIRGKDILFWLAVLGAGGTGLSSAILPDSDEHHDLDKRIVIIETRLANMEAQLTRIENKIDQ